jgi:hypothetical protein
VALKMQTIFNTLSKLKNFRYCHRESYCSFLAFALNGDSKSKRRLIDISATFAITIVRRSIIIEKAIKKIFDTKNRAKKITSDNNISISILKKL